MLSSITLTSLVTVLMVVCVGHAEGARAPRGKEQAQPAQPAQAASSPFSLTLSAGQSRVQVGFPVIVKIVAKNITNHKILLWWENAYDQGGFVYRADVRDDKNNLSPDTKFGRRVKSRGVSPNMAPEDLMVGSGGYLPMKPGESRTDLVNVRKLCDLTHPGKYTIQVSRFDDESKTWVKSNFIGLTVIP